MQFINTRGARILVDSQIGLFQHPSLKKKRKKNNSDILIYKTERDYSFVFRKTPSMPRKKFEESQKEEKNVKMSKIRITPVKIGPKSDRSNETRVQSFPSYNREDHKDFSEQANPEPSHFHPPNSTSII